MGGSVTDKYNLSFDAHLDLVTIHPWVDGNGRTCRLLMNYLQYEFGLIPTKILKEDKTDYIQAMEKSREKESYEPFREYMQEMMIRNLSTETENYRKEMEEDI